MLIALTLSLAVHLSAALVIVLLPRVLPREARPQEQGTVELLMVERKGATPSEAGQPRDSQPTDTQPTPAPPQPEKTAPSPKAEAQKQHDTASPPAPPVAESADEPAPSPAEETPPRIAKANQDKPDAQPAVAPPKPPEGPVFDLSGTDSESDAKALGAQILPASPDNRFRNRPPIFPREAARNGDHGTVDVVIHVSEAGFATGVDIVQSSGVASLDQAAVDAVRKWRFHPALREGRTVPFDMPFRFVFEDD